MTKAVLITASPRNALTGAAAPFLMAGGGRAKPYYYSGNHFRAGVTQLLRLGSRIEWDDEGWTGGVVPSTGTLAWAPSSKAALAAAGAYYWRNAAISVDEVDEDSGVLTNRLAGKVADALPRGDKLEITIADLAAGLSRPAVTGRFAGTGGVEGGAEAAGRIKRRTWGRAFNIEGRIFDKANNIYEFGDDAFPWQSFDLIRDGGRDATPAPAVVTWQGSIAATLATLAAAVPVQGSGVAAPSIAKVKWWTQARGPLTADVRGEVGSGYVETVPEIAARILAAVGGPSITNVSTATGWRAGVAGIHVDEGEDINALLTRLLMGVSLLWIFNAAAGTITLREFTFSSPVASLVSSSISRERTLPPMKTRRVAYQRSYRLHSDGDIVTSLLQEDPAAGSKLIGIADGATVGRNRIMNPAAETGSVSPWITDESAVAMGTLTADATGAASGKWRFLMSKGSTTHGFNAVHPAIPVTPGRTYLVRLALSGNGIAAASGLYLRMNQRSSAPASGYVTQGQRTSLTDLVSNGPVAAAMSSGAYPYTVPAGVQFVSPAIYNWQGGPLGLAFDDVEFYELTDHELGADVTATANPTHTYPASQTFYFNADLTAKTGQLPRTLVFRRFKGATEVTQDDDTEWSVTPIGCSAAVNNIDGSGVKGQVTITAIATSGYVAVTSTKAGGAPVTTVVDTFKATDEPASAGGAGSTGFDSAASGAVTTANSAAPQAVAAGTMRSNGSGQVVFRGEVYYTSVGTGSTSALYAKWQKSLAGANSWSDTSLGYVLGTGASTTGGYEPETNPGVVSAAGTATGLTPNTDYDFRLVAYKVGANANTYTETNLTGRQA